MTNWKDETKHVLNNINKSCEQYENAHEINIAYYKKIVHYGLIFSVSLVFTNSLLSSLVSGKIIVHPSLTIVIAVLSALLGTSSLFGMYYLDPTTKLTQHTDSKNKYRNIINRVDWHLFFAFKHQEETDTFIKEICKEMLEIETNTETPSIYDKNAFNEKRVLRKLFKTESKKQGFIKKQSSSDLHQDSSFDDEEMQNRSKQSSSPEIIGLSEEENIDFGILFNPSELQFQRDRLNL